MAEREGFEPSLPVKVNTLSRRADSTTLPPLQPELWKRLVPWFDLINKRFEGKKRGVGHGLVFCLDFEILIK